MTPASSHPTDCSFIHYYIWVEAQEPDPAWQLIRRKMTLIEPDLSSLSSFLLLRTFTALGFHHRPGLVNPLVNCWLYSLAWPVLMFLTKSCLGQTRPVKLIIRFHIWSRIIGLFSPSPGQPTAILGFICPLNNTSASHTMSCHPARNKANFSKFGLFQLCEKTWYPLD